MGIALATKASEMGVHNNVPPKIRVLSEIELQVLGLNSSGRNGVSRANQPLESLELAKENSGKEKKPGGKGEKKKETRRVEITDSGRDLLGGGCYPTLRT